MQLRCGDFSIVKDEGWFSRKSSGEMFRARNLIRGKRADEDVGLQETLFAAAVTVEEDAGIDEGADECEAMK